MRERFEGRGRPFALAIVGLAAVAQSALVEAAEAPQATAPQAAPAQATPPPPAPPQSGQAVEADNDTVAQVVVTGSRVVTNGANAPTPLTAVSASQLQAAAPSSIVDALVQLPQIANSSLPQNTGVGTTGNVGQSFLSLRSLGANRTLILMDGSRIVPSSLQAVTDVSLIPEALVQRVDIVTGGASAVYGSDAVAGVVNFVLDTHYTGVKAEIQGGESGYQDARNGKVELTAGWNLFDGRGHFVISGDTYQDNGVSDYASRDWFHSCALIGNPAKVPTYIPACNAHSAQFTYGGLIATGPLAGTQFGPGAVPMPFNHGTLATTSTMVGGSGAGGANPDVGAYFQPVPGVRRQHLFAHGDFEVSDQIEAYAQVLFARSNSWYNSTYPWQGQGSGYTIQLDNAFLPASVHQAMINDGVTSFLLNRYDEDFGPLYVQTVNRTEEFKVGIHAHFGDWKIEAYAQHGENHFNESTDNNPIVSNEYNAADAVLNPANGQIVCRSTLTQPGNGCVPINLFGYGSPSAAAKAYVTATSQSWIHDIQDVAEASASATPFSLWAGPVTIALGSGYRRESSDQTSDPISAGLKSFTGGYLGFPPALNGVFGGFDRGNLQPVSGWYNLWEVFGETLVPLAKDVPFAQSLDFNGAVRYTNYSTSGGVTSWKAGLTWQPVDSVRLRAARSRDIRAPNVNELYLGKNQGQSNLIDDFQAPGSANRNPIVFTVMSGSAALKPEIADTTTYGIVLTPTWLRHFTASIDRYTINIKDAITTLTGQQIIDQCFGGATSLCNLLTRDANGVLTTVNTPYLNIGEEEASGVDVELDYMLGLSELSSALNGDLAFRMLANHVDHLTEIVPGSPAILLAGQTGGGGGVPHWTSTASVQYTNHPVSLFVQERFIGPGKLSNQYTTAQLDPAYNHVDSVFYTDFTLNYDFGVGHKDWGMFFTINNVFNRAPPAAAQPYFVFGTSAGGTNASLFDVVGRAYTLGFKLNF
jgi:outer membrane receptor protein involved in Fe transport